MRQPFPSRRISPGQLLRAGLLLLLTPSLAAGQDAAGADWPMFRGSPSLRGVAPGSLSAPLELHWTFSASQAVTSSPAIADGRVFFGSDDGCVYAVDLAAGKELWKYQTEDIIEAPPLVLDGVVYVGSSDAFLYAIDARDGALRWKGSAEDRILGGANWLTGADGKKRVVVGSYDCRLYCFDAADGTSLWTYETDNYVNGTPAVEDGRIVFGGCDAGLHVVSGETGELITKVEMGEACHVAGSVALDGSHAYLGHYGNAVIAADLAEPKLLWMYPSRDAFFSSPALAKDRLVIGGRDKQMHCIRREDGAPLWTARTRRRVDASPVICGDKVVAGGGDGRLYLWSLETGEEVFQYEIGQPILSSPAVAHGVVIVGCNDGGVYAFGAPRDSGS